jgi:hypothetical protein
MAIVRKRNALRWLLVLPGSLLAAVLSSFPLHIVLYLFLTKWANPYPETPERFLLPLVAAIAFVLAGASIAPLHRKAVAVCLASGWISAVLTAYSIFATADVSLGNYVVTPDFLGFSSLGSIVGALSAIYVVHRRSSITVTQQQNHEDFIRLWGAAGVASGYNKKEWLSIEKQLLQAKAID